MKKINLLILSIFLFGSLSAQKDSIEIFDIDFEDLLNMDITVASKSSEKLSEAPSSVTVFTAREIRNLGVNSLEELLHFVPGFQVSIDIEQGKTFKISSRGRSSAISESVLVLVDGYRLNDLYTGGVSVINRYIATGNIKQVEIIRGPGSSLYGSNAFTGVINIITLSQVNSLSFSAGNLNSKRIGINQSYSINENFQVDAYLSYFSDKGSEYNDSEDAYGRQIATQDPVTGMDAYISLKYKDLKLNIRNMQRELNNFYGFGQISNGTNSDNSTQTSITLSYQKEFSEKLQFDFFAGISSDEWSSIFLAIPANFEVAPGFSLSENFIAGPYIKSVYADLQANISYQLHETNNLQFGIHGGGAAIRENSNIMTHNPITLEYVGDLYHFTDDLAFNENELRNIFSIFLQDKQTLFENLNLTLGIRMDHYSDFGTSVNPRLAIVYSTPFNSVFKTMYAKAFRAPNFLELYDKNNPIDFGNPDLDAETITTFEVSYNQALDNMNLSLTYFQNDITDFIQFGNVISDPKNPLGAPQFVNTDGYNSSGLEFEFRAAYEKLKFFASYTYLFDSENLPISAQTAAAYLNYSFDKLDLNLNGYYKSKFDLFPIQENYFVLNLNLQFHANDKATVFSTFRNLLNEEYKSFTYIIANGIENRGFSFEIGLRYKL